MRTPVARIVARGPLPGIDLFVQLTCEPVIVGGDIGALGLGYAINQAEGSLGIFGATLHVPGLFVRDSAKVVSHGKARIDCDGSLKQRDGCPEVALAHDGKARGVVLKSLLIRETY